MVQETEAYALPLRDLVSNRDMQTTFERARIAGIDFDFLTAGDVASAIAAWRRDARGTRHITLTNPHSVMLCKRDDLMYDATRNAALTLPDGIGVILAAYLLGFGRQHRVAGPHLMLEVCDSGRQYGLRHFFYGGAPGVVERLSDRLMAKYPNLDVVGAMSPPFSTEVETLDDETIEIINASGADIVWIGLGAPKQEKWMFANANALQCTALIGVGAAFDFHSGNIAWAPNFVRAIGLEWAFRLCCEPRRLWKRNLDSPLFLFHALMGGFDRSSRRLSDGSILPSSSTAQKSLDRI